MEAAPALLAGWLCARVNILEICACVPGLIPPTDRGSRSRRAYMKRTRFDDERKTNSVRSVSMLGAKVVSYQCGAYYHMTLFPLVSLSSTCNSTRRGGRIARI